MGSVSSRQSRCGSALLAVLWTIIALTAIGFAMAANVRTEIDRASLSVDSAKAYFLAQGAIEAAMQRIVRPPNREDPEAGFDVGQRFMRFHFPTGRAEVEIVGESGKLDINQASPQALAQLLSFSGLDPGRAVMLAAGIIDFRTRLRRGRVRRFGPREGAQTNLSSDSSFEGQPASIQQVEELLAVPGMTPDLLYGTFRRVEGEQAGGERKPGLVRVGGLIRNLTTEGAALVNANYASVEMLRAAGLSDSVVAAIDDIRRLRPLRPEDLGGTELGNGEITLGLGGGSKRFTLTATARLPENRAVRSVAAMVELGVSEGPDPIRIVRWYDQPF